MSSFTRPPLLVLLNLGDSEANLALLTSYRYNGAGFFRRPALPFSPCCHPERSEGSWLALHIIDNQSTKDVNSASGSLDLLEENAWPDTSFSKALLRSKLQNMGRTDEELLAKQAMLMARDADQIAQIKAYGVDLGKKRQIDLTFWAPDEKSANVFVEALKRNEMPPSLVLGPASEKEADQRWVIRSSLSASVDFITAKENMEAFVLFADKFDCDYDGWGTAIVEAADLSQPSS